MSKKIDMTGWKMWEHGVPDSKLIVVEEAPKISAHAQWKCLCTICNNYCIVDGTKLRSGHTKTCGCKTNRKKELQGKKLGMLTVLNENPTYREEHNIKHKYIFWDCICECGNKTTVSAHDLVSGRTQSCGCLRAKLANEKKRQEILQQKFDMLTPLEPTDGRSNDGSIIWKFQCDCGNITYLPINQVTNGHYTSCGQHNRSVGEQRINKILTDANISFLHDKGYFQDLVSKNGTVLRYDFIIFQDNEPIRIIEFDGPQHYECREYGPFSNKDRYERQQYHDSLKNEYARTHNIPLVRIPYKERDHITIDLLMGDKYLVI